MSDNSGSFQLNDIILNISPQKIRVERQSFNNKWQTLRTQSSVKSKSGFSVLDIYVTADFTDDKFSIEGRNGFRQLRDLISQFRVTPFCYVENDLLRDQILGGETSQSMALVLKQMDITKSNRPSEVNVITVNFHFAWFNYFPFSKDFSFREEIGGLTPVKNPINSQAWLYMYIAEQLRHPYREVDSLQTGLTLILKQYKSITIEKYNEIRDKEVASLKALREDLSLMTKNKEGPGILNSVQDFLAKELNDKNWGRA